MRSISHGTSTSVHTPRPTLEEFSKFNGVHGNITPVLHDKNSSKINLSTNIGNQITDSCKQSRIMNQIELSDNSSCFDHDSKYSKYLSKNDSFVLMEPGELFKNINFVDRKESSLNSPEDRHSPSPIQINVLEEAECQVDDEAPVEGQRELRHPDEIEGRQEAPDPERQVVEVENLPEEGIPDPENRFPRRRSISLMVVEGVITGCVCLCVGIVSILAISTAFGSARR